MPKVTMRDIAKRAGVSPTTVAHTLNNTPEAQVAQKTREKVWQAAKQLGYQRSLLRRSIKDPLRHLGIAIGRPGQEDELDTDALFEGIRIQAQENRYIPIMQAMPTSIGQTDSSDAARQIINLYRQKLLDGLILDKQCFPNVSVTDMSGHGVPLVTVNGSFEAVTAEGDPIPGVIYDSRHGARLAVNHLLELGHRRIGLITRPFYRYSMPFRPMLIRTLLIGFWETLESAGILPDDHLFRDGSPLDRQLTARALDELLALPDPPTALFVADDAMAVMAINHLRLCGLRVPQDMSVIGYGDHALPVLLAQPELTTIRTDLHENGRQAAEMLIHLLEGVPLPQRQIMLQPELIVRASTAPPATTTD